jgi:hypothetical protein
MPTAFAIEKLLEMSFRLQHRGNKCGDSFPSASNSRLSRKRERQTTDATNRLTNGPWLMSIWPKPWNGSKTCSAKCFSQTENLCSQSSQRSSFLSPSCSRLFGFDVLLTYPEGEFALIRSNTNFGIMWLFRSGRSSLQNAQRVIWSPCQVKSQLDTPAIVLYRRHPKSESLYAGCRGGGGGRWVARGRGVGSGCVGFGAW